MKAVVEMLYAVPCCRPVSEHLNGLSVDETVHSFVPSFKITLKEVIGDPGGRVGKVTAISVFDSAVACTPDGAVFN